MFLLSGKVGVGEIRIRWFITDMPFMEAAMSVAEWDVFQLAIRYKIKGYDAADIAQELRFQLWKKLPLYDPTRASLRTFCNRVMKNHLKNLNKASRRHKRIIQFYQDELKEE